MKRSFLIIIFFLLLFSKAYAMQVHYSLELIDDLPLKAKIHADSLKFTDSDTNEIIETKVAYFYYLPGEPRLQKPRITSTAFLFTTINNIKIQSTGCKLYEYTGNSDSNQASENQAREKLEGLQEKYGSKRTRNSQYQASEKLKELQERYGSKSAQTKKSNPLDSCVITISNQAVTIINSDGTQTSLCDNQIKEKYPELYISEQDFLGLNIQARAVGESSRVDRWEAGEPLEGKLKYKLKTSHGKFNVFDNNSFYSL